LSAAATVTNRETKLVATCAAVAVAALIAAVAAVAVAIVLSQRDRERIRSLERQVDALCARTTVSGVRQGPDLRLRVTTARGC
jgi:hypothetical protein